MAESVTPSEDAMGSFFEEMEEVAGLLIPGDLATQIVQSFREVYPEVTGDKDDRAAVRATLIWFITHTMETAANNRANVALTETIEQLRAGAEIRGQQRRQDIHAAAKRIQEKPDHPPGQAAKKG